MISSLQPSRPKLQPLSPPRQQIHYSSTQPRSQIEAMPPYLHTSTRTISNPAMRHPVFFTEKLVKAPTGVSAGCRSWESPVAAGYVFEEGQRREGGARL